MIASCHHSDTHIIYNNAFFYIYLFLLLVNPNSPRAQVDLHQFLKIHVRLIFCSDNINNYQSFFKMCIIFPSISIALIGHHRRLFSPPDVINEPMRPSLNPVPPFPFFLSFLARKSSSYVGGWGGISLSFFVFSVFWWYYLMWLGLRIQLRWVELNLLSNNQSILQPEKNYTNTNNDNKWRSQ